MEGLETGYGFTKNVAVRLWMISPLISDDVVTGSADVVKRGLCERYNGYCLWARGEVRK